MDQEENKIKIGEYKTVFKGKIFEIQQAEVVLPSGTTAIWERALRPASVCVVPLNDKGELLLTREFRQAYDKTIWFLTTGAVDEGESPEAAAQRELREEIGYRASRLIPLRIENRSNKIVWDIYTYIAVGLTHDPLHADEGEEIEVVPTSIERAFEMVFSGEIEDTGVANIIIRVYAMRDKLPELLKS